STAIWISPRPVVRTTVVAGVVAGVLSGAGAAGSGCCARAGVAMRPASSSGRIHGERRMRFMVTDRMILRPRMPMERPMSRMLAAGLLVLSGISPAFAAAPDCDRSCLAGFIDQYVDALVAGNPQRLAVTDAVRFTEDSRELPLGEGLWKATLTRGGFRH